MTSYNELLHDLSTPEGKELARNVLAVQELSAESIGKIRDAQKNPTIRTALDRIIEQKQ